jgi:hypothetical protein
MQKTNLGVVWKGGEKGIFLFGPSGVQGTRKRAHGGFPGEVKMKNVKVKM